jgi:hypothetical protein
MIKYYLITCLTIVFFNSVFSQKLRIGNESYFDSKVTELRLKLTKKVKFDFNDSIATFYSKTFTGKPEFRRSTVKSKFQLYFVYYSDSIVCIDNYPDPLDAFDQRIVFIKHGDFWLLRATRIVGAFNYSPSGEWIKFYVRDTRRKLAIVMV